MAAPLVRLVDDDALLGEVLQGQLEGEGLRSFWVPDASAALDLIPVLDPSLVVADLMLPVMGGLDLLSIIDRSWTAGVSRFMAMGESPSLLRQAMDLGAVSVLQKPFLHSAFVNSVLGALDLGERIPVALASGNVPIPAGIQDWDAASPLMEDVARLLGADSAVFIPFFDSGTLAFGAGFNRGGWLGSVMLSPLALALDPPCEVWMEDLHRYSVLAGLSCSNTRAGVEPARAFASVPAYGEGGLPMGCLAVSHRSVRAWSHFDAAMLRKIAVSIATDGSSGSRAELERMIELYRYK